MVSAPRCPPGARGLLALLLLLPLRGARGQCGALPMLSRASPQDTSCTEGCPIGTEVTYRCHDGFVKIPGKSDTVVCLSNSEWSTFGEFCSAGCDAPPRLKSATLSKEDEQKNYSPTGSTVSYVCRPGYESTELKRVITCLENLTWSEAPEFCRGKSCGVPKGPEHGRAVVLTNDLYGARANIICDEGFRLHGRTFIQCLLKGDQVEWSQLPTCQDQCVPPRRLHHDTNGKEVPDRCNYGPGKSPEPGFDTRIGIPGIGSNIATVTGITVAAIAIAIAIVTGIVAALKKKGFYSVNPDSPKHQITTEHDPHMNESKCNLIFKGSSTLLINVISERLPLAH